MQESIIDIAQIVAKFYSEYKNIKAKADEEIAKMPETNNKLNVLIAGKTGVGKSTIINTVFGSNVADVGDGKPVTQNIKQYHINEKFSIYDTKGLEMKAFDETILQIKNLLNEQKTKPADEQIHLAWLCISEPARRIEDGEKELYKLLNDNKIPTIIVITKASQDANEKGIKFSSIARDEFDINDDLYIQRVRALEITDDEGQSKKIMGITKNAKGEDGLIEKSYKLLDEGFKEAFARHQQYSQELKQKAKARERARNIINYYSAATASVAITPIAFSDFFLILPTQIGMITHLSNAYGLDLSADTAKKLAVAFISVAGAGFGVKLAFGSILKIIPALGSIGGGAINASIAGATTKLMGHAYLSYLDDNFSQIEHAIRSISPEIFAKYWQKAKILFPNDAKELPSK